MPVERSTVRFLDNFSSGQRGAASAEYPTIIIHSIKASEYLIVIFLHCNQVLPSPRLCSVVPTQELFIETISKTFH